MDQKKGKKILIIGLLICIAAWMILNDKTPGNPDDNSPQVCFTSGCFNVEIAATDQERQQGLMYRTQMDEGSGMLFIFDEEGSYPFWMKNTLIPLDIIWITQDMKVAHIGAEARPCEEDPCPLIMPFATATYVLEVNAGMARRMNINVGDEATFKAVARGT